MNIWHLESIVNSKKITLSDPHYLYLMGHFIRRGIRWSDAHKC